MCGINGLFTEVPETKKKIASMNFLVRHRGPDDEGFVCINSTSNHYKIYSGSDSIDIIKNSEPHINTAGFNNFNLILAHRRLSIIDLSENGHEPMTEESHKIWITYNGEIYNYIELREELKAFGHIFRTNTDTEVIIKAYLQWGTDCFNKFNGMWAFALWDGINKQLLLSRDRFGIKPLYYIIKKGLFAFSSELKPLAYLLGDKVEINELKIPQFIIYGNRVNVENTYLKNIFSLLPSHYIIYKNGEIKTKKYYDIQRNILNIPEESLKSRMDDLFTESIKLRFRSDVKVGTCLSGGFDSSSIVAYSNKFLTQPLETFSAVWDDKKSDESQYIDLINTRFGCIENKIKPKSERFEKIFKDIHYYQEIPTEGPGLYPQWHVMKVAEKKAKVLLNGQGGDEVFGGYFSTGTLLRSLIKDKSFIKIIKNLGNYAEFFKQNSMHSFINWIFPKTYRYFVQKNFSAQFKIFNNDFIKDYKVRTYENSLEPVRNLGNYVNSMSYHFITSVTIPALLHYEDRASMAHSIESRVPFLDYRLVEFGLNLKPEYLIKKGISRPLFRSVVEEHLPEEITKRKDKLGYPTPFSEWIKSGLKEYVMCVLGSGNSDLYEYIDKDKVINNILKKHMSGETDYGWEIWRLLSLDEFIHLFKAQKYLIF
jgi:asparagine synthase (glutamine-hydrolysing)